MPAQKRTNYLLQDSDQESGDEISNTGYDSEEHESKVARASKRRKVTPGEAEHSDIDSIASGEEDEQRQYKHTDDGEQPIDDNESASDLGEDEPGSEEDAGQPGTRHPISERKTPQRTTKPEKPSKRKKPLKTGIIYLPRLPPFLKPNTLRTLLTPYTKHGVSRLFLTPESPSARIQRLRSGGNKKHLYTDGWVEFHSKTDAKTVVDACNGRIIGGKKGGYYRDDVWSMRYLRGFKWGDLVGERRDEEAERTGRLEAERRKGKREVALFLGNVERAKVKETRRKKEEARVKEGGEAPGRREKLFTYRQNEVLRKTGSERESKGPAEEVKRVLSKIF